MFPVSDRVVESTMRVLLWITLFNIF